MCAPKLVLPLALISLHQWGWELLGWDISFTIHQHGYFMGSSFSLSGPVWDQEWDSPWDGTAGTLGWAPSCWHMVVLGAFDGVGSWAGKLGVLFHWGPCPQLRRRAMFVGKFGSSSTLKQTFLLSFSSSCREMSCHCVLLLDSQDLGHRQRFSMEQWSCSSAGQDHGQLAEGDWHQLGCAGGL